MAKQTIKMVIQLRRDTTENWLINKDVVPAAGEPCFDLDLKTLKIGDGTTTYENLSIIGGSEGVEFTADGKSVVLEEGILKLAGFDAAEAGMQLRKAADGSIEWFAPSTETVDGLQTAVADLQSDVTTLQTNVTTIENNVATLQEIVNPSGEGAVSLLGRVEGLEEKVGGTTVSEQIDKKINEFATKVSDDGTVNTIKELVDYVAAHGGEVATMAADITSLKELVGGTSVSTQILEAIEASGHIAEEKTMATFEKVKYEISSKPVGTLVNYGEKEIRVMCPSDTKWVLQNSGENADAFAYYIGFKAYAPDNSVVSFREDLAQTISDKTMYSFEGNEFAGIDKFGRKYSIVWLPVAKYDEATSTWSYYGAQSIASKYIGWYYSVEWYNADGIKVAADTIRINLSNEACHSAIEPYFMANVVKGVSVGGTLLDMVEGKVDIPVGAGLKGSEEIIVNEDGSLSVGQISFSKIVQTEEKIVLDGGSAAK